VVQALIGALVLAVVSTLGDYIWDVQGLRHRVVYGLVHGAAVCLSVGAVVGWRARKPILGAAAGMAIGIAAAGMFYLLAPWLRYSAMFPSWMFFWICFALLQEGLDSAPAYASAAKRGLAAALLSGLAFYAISGIWTRPSPGGPDYPRHFISWAFAFFPGFAALFAGRRTGAGSTSASRGRGFQ
jgi:hypothetical protein